MKFHFHFFEGCDIDIDTRLSDNKKGTYITMGNEKIISEIEPQQNIIVKISNVNGTCMEIGTEFTVRIHLQEAVNCTDTGIVVYLLFLLYTIYGGNCTPIKSWV